MTTDSSLTPEEQLGFIIVSAIVKGNLLRVEYCEDHPEEESDLCNSRHAFVWSPNAFEQIGAFVNELIKEEMSH
jgi:hypothetical protein